MWNQEMTRSLYQIVYLKFNDDFWGDKEGWGNYLDSFCIPFEEGKTVQVLCPTTYCPRIRKRWSMAARNRWIYIPMDMAVKIVALGVMP